MSGTDAGYAAFRQLDTISLLLIFCTTVSGTEICYAATRLYWATERGWSRVMRDPAICLRARYAIFAIILRAR
eukprot:2848179-Rhodomonas_salina.3